MTNEQLVLRVRTGEDAAVNMYQLWQQNRGFIHKIVNQYKDYAEEDDLEQEGYLGLCDAVEHYDPEEGVTFIHYASYWIKQSIGRYVKNNGTIRLPEYMQGRIREYERMVQKWQQNYHRKPSDREICRFLELSQEMLKNLKKAAQMGRITSLDISVGEEEDNSLYDLIPSGTDEEEQLLEKIQREQLCAIIWPLVDALPGNQPKVIRFRYQENKTLKETAENLGISIERVRQLEASGFRELRKPSKSRILRPFLPDDERIYSMALRGNGADHFNVTWTSSTERAALKRI